uniref:HSP100.4 n=1 Tax=Aeluropus littoralis TaxID=110874 RepID=A0A8G1GN01_9POAL|nr:HSP100.4 [Aeluropus littoralis]
MFQKLSNATALPRYNAGHAGVGGSGSNVVIKKESALATYGRDMTAAAGKMDPVIGRDDEIDRVVCILCRRTKNSAMLLGAPGVGKTAIAEGLAQRIAAGTVPAALIGARVVERIKKVIQEAENADGKVVLFIDEVHMLLGAGQGKGAMDGANLLKPALARGRIRCVGATTFEEHRKHVEKDAAFERRFQKVHVQEPSMVATIAILQGLKRKYEEHHGTTIQDVAIVAATRFANRYITGRQFPDKAIDLIDEACSTARMQTDNILKETSTQHNAENAMKEAIVSPCQVAQVVSRWTGIPVDTLDQDEKRKLVHLADRLRERVVGQEAAVNLVAQAVLRSRAGLDDPGQPIGSFLFLGSTGVGKTELAKALAEQLFDSEKMLIRFDMTEFVGTHSVLRLIGAPPSYHGHEDGGQLTEKVRQRPYSVILFDEIEKADPAVFNVFLQLFDDGVLTDGKGRTVDFKNTIIIMTSNLGAEHLMEAISGGKSIEAARELVIQQVQKHFKPEFLNRLSELVIFEPLPQDKLKVVANVQMKSIIARVANKGVTLRASDAALDVILSESHNPLYGARPLKRWLQKNVMTKLSEMLVRGQIDADTTVIIDATEDRKDLKYEVVKNRAMPASPSHRHGKMPVVESDADSDDEFA